MSIVSDHEDPRDDDFGMIDLESFSKRTAQIHNFEGNPREVWTKVSYATGPSCGKGTDIVGKPFALTHWLLHEAVFRREDGSLSRAVRTVLVDKDGRCYGFVSDGVYQSLRRLVADLGSGPYDPPVDIVVAQQTMKGGRRFYAIEPAPTRESKKGVSSK